ncbi:3671_t:CDS:2, partial [Gigaspora margarita]
QNPENDSPEQYSPRSHYQNRISMAKNEKTAFKKKQNQLNESVPTNEETSINEEASINEKASINEEAPINKEILIIEEASINEEVSINKEVSDKHVQLISTIQILPDKELASVSSLFSIMRYSKGQNKRKIISPYLQQKAYDYFTQIQQSKQITEYEFHKQVKLVFKSGKQNYTPDVICLATKISQVGQMLLRSTVEHIQLFSKQILQLKNAPAFGIMVNESTQGQIKNLIVCYQFWNKKEHLPNVIVAQLQNIMKCNADTISNAVIKHIQEYNIDIKKCIVWTTDNTSYMSGKKNSAIVLFNKKTSGNSLQIENLQEELKEARTN